MINFKTLSFAGVMLVSTIGFAMAQTPTPLTFTICCPQNVSLNTGTCSPNTDCYLACNSSSCQAVSSAGNANWAINFQKAFQGPVPLGPSQAITVINKTPLILKCIYKNNIDLVYALSPLPYVNSYVSKPSGCMEFTSAEGFQRQGKKHKQ